MPAAIGAVVLGSLSGVAGLGTLAGSTVFGFSLAGLVGNAIVTGVLIGANYLLTQNNQKREKTDPAQLQTKQAVPPRIRGYGRSKLGGALYFFETKSGSLVQGLVHCEGPIDGYELWYLNDIPANILPNTTGGAANVAPWGANIEIQSLIGDEAQGASPVLVSMFPGAWTADHRLAGLAHSVMVCKPVKEKDFQKTYPNGAPSLSVVARLSLVFDPRNNASYWSDNPALCILDFLTHSRGFAIPLGRIYLNDFSNFANLCDGLVATSAGTEKRYRLGGTFTMTEEPRDVLRRMLDTCDGEIYSRPDGLIGIRGGQWEPASVVITDDDILSYTYEAGGDKLSSFNRLKVTFTDPSQQYQLIETDHYDDLNDQDQRGEVLTKDLDLRMVQSPSQASRLAKIAMAKGNPRHRLQIVTGPAGIDALGESVIHVRLHDILIDTTFRVVPCEPSSDLTTCSLTLTSLDDSAYGWSVAEELSTPGEPPDTTSGVTVETPENLVIIQDSAPTKIRATVDPPANTALTFHPQYKLVADASWTDMIVDLGNDWSALSGSVADGSTYQVRAQFTAPFGGTEGAWTPTESIKITTDLTAPGLPTAVGISKAGTTVTVTWTAANSANHHGVRVYRGTSTFGAATLLDTVYGAPNSTGTYDDVGLAAGTYIYWVAAINPSGIASTEVLATPNSIAIP